MSKIKVVSVLLEHSSHLLKTSGMNAKNLVNDMFDNIQRIATALLIAATASSQLVSCEDILPSDKDMRSAFQDTKSYVKTFDQQGNTMSKIEGESIRVSVDHNFDVKNTEGEVNDQSEVLEIESNDSIPLDMSSFPSTSQHTSEITPQEKDELKETSTQDLRGENSSLSSSSTQDNTNEQIEHKTIYHYGSPLIIEEVGVDNVFDKESYDIVGQPYINYLKENYKDKNSIVMVQAQDYTPIAAYVGNEVKLSSVSDIPSSAIITIDGKKLFLYKTNYSIYDSDLVDPLQDAIDKINEEEKEKTEKSQHDLFKLSDILNPENH